MEPALALWLVGFGSVGLGWLLDHMGEATDPVEDRIEIRTILSRVLYGLGFLISAIGAAVVIQVAISPLQYIISP
jgi:hypothetical protein